MKLICDSGSTKSAWCLINGTSLHHYSTQGINPFQQSEERIADILRNELKPQMEESLSDANKNEFSNPQTSSSISEVHFFGAGCTKEKSPIVARCVEQLIAPQAIIDVQSDMLGAAIALCKKEPGIVCILGTGSNSAYYDGENLTNCIPALGYILGDEGSGAYLGKRLVGDILKCQFSERIRNLFFAETGETQGSIIQKTYRESMANRYLASLSPFCARHLEEEEIQDFITDCFSQFFERNIMPMSQMMRLTSNKVNCVGSIAHYYKEQISKVAQKYGFEISTILKEPIDGLVDYYKQTFS